MLVRWVPVEVVKLSVSSSAQAARVKKACAESLDRDDFAEFGDRLDLKLPEVQQVKLKDGLWNLRITLRRLRTTGVRSSRSHW